MHFLVVLGVFVQNGKFYKWALGCKCFLMFVMN